MTGAGSSSIPSSSSLPLEGRVAIVTGASGGIGRAIAIHLQSLGAKLVLNYSSNSDQADLLASELNSSSSAAAAAAAVAIRADISDPDQTKLLFDQAEKQFGTQAHILVNCAGVIDPKYPSVANTAVEDWDKLFAVNTRGAFLCCKEAANRLCRGGGGRIIMTTTSVVGGLFPGYAAYASSKAAVETMTKILAKELKGTGITANCVAPGPVATEFFFAGKTEETVKRMMDACPLGRIGEPKDVSQVVGFLATDAALIFLPSLPHFPNPTKAADPWVDILIILNDPKLLTTPRYLEKLEKITCGNGFFRKA